MSSLFSSIPVELPDEFTETLVRAKNVSIERIVSRGHASSEGFWHDQHRNEWVLVIQGSARLRIENEIVIMNPGDWIDIPAHRRHRVEWTTPTESTIWLAVFYD